MGLMRFRVISVFFLVGAAALGLMPADGQQPKMTCLGHCLVLTGVHNREE